MAVKDLIITFTAYIPERYNVMDDEAKALINKMHYILNGTYIERNCNNLRELLERYKPIATPYTVRFQAVSMEMGYPKGVLNITLEDEDSERLKYRTASTLMNLEHQVYILPRPLVERTMPKLLTKNIVYANKDEVALKLNEQETKRLARKIAKSKSLY